MKKLSVLLVALLSVTLVVEEAHAKRMGGGKSFGRTQQTAPAQPDRAQAAPGQQRQAAQPAQSPSQAAAPAAGAAKKGMMGGLLGGLLAGGLIAALFAGGAFEGLQLMDILIFALLGFLIFKLVAMFRQGGARQPAYAGNGRGEPQPVRQPEPVATPAPAQRAAISAVSGTGAIPFNLPLGFDTPAFLEEAGSHYRTLQDAWNRNDMASLREYLTPELHAALSAERASLAVAPSTEVLSVRAELVRADQRFGMAEVSIRFSGRYRDRVEGVEEDFIDIWHLERDYGRADAPWHITGIETA